MNSTRPTQGSAPRLAALLVLTVFLGLCGCTGGRRDHPPAGGGLPIVDASLKGAMEKTPSESLRLAAEGIRHLDRGELVEASTSFNQALKLDPTNSWLQLLNGTTYHLRAIRGDASFFDLAETGYRLAMRFDPSNWIAHYQTGLLYMDRRDWSRAREAFAETLAFRPDDPNLLYAMGCACYEGGDPASAAAVLSHLRTLEPSSLRSTRASAMALAAIDRREEARACIEEYRKAGASPSQGDEVTARVRDWEAFHDGCPAPADDSTPGAAHPAVAPAPAAPAPNPPVDAGAPGLGDAQGMVLVDVVILRNDESTATHKGVNFLNGLQVQFGNTATPLGWNFSHTKTSGTPRSQVAGFTAPISAPNLTYSLNIFNSAYERTEILAMPTLTALDGVQSEFFAGLNVNAAAVSGGSTYGSSVEVNKEIGITLKVTPTLMDKGRVKLCVYAEHNMLEEPSDNVVYDHQMIVSQTHVQTSVIMQAGETLVLSGLSDKETVTSRDGVPFMQDIPGLQYLFSRKAQENFQRSVLILLTPRLPEYIFTDNPKFSRDPARLAGGGAALEALRSRYVDWFRPYSNLDSAMYHLQTNDLYQEFRTGDVTNERWWQDDSFRLRLRQAIGFLYY